MKKVNALAVIDRLLADPDVQSKHALDFYDVREALSDLIKCTREYRKLWGWGGDRITERAAERLDAALARIDPDGAA